MKSILQIVNALDKELINENKRFLTLNQANKILYTRGLISKDEKSTQAFKKLLEGNKIPNASQTKEKPKQWRIFLSEKGKKKLILGAKKGVKKIKHVKPCTVCPNCGVNLTINEKVNKFQELECLICNYQFKNPNFDSLNKINQRELKVTKPNEFSIFKNIKGWVMGIFGLIIVYFIATNDTNSTEVKNSPWDSSVHQVESYLKRTLTDPNSFEVIQWSKVRDMTHNQYGYRYIVMVKYRAKNNYGIYVIESNTFYLDKNGNVVDVN